MKALMATLPYGLLHEECRHGNLERVKDLVDHKRYDINERRIRYAYDTPLHVACGHRRPQIVEFLLSKLHCDLNAQDFYGDTPLHVACSSIDRTSLHLDIDCVKLLLARDDIKVNLHNRYGDTPLHLAFQSNNPELVKLLLVHPDIEVDFHNAFGDTPLHLASKWNYPAVVKLLLAHPDIQVNAQTRNGSTPLYFASQVNLPEIVTLLLAHHGIQVNLKNRDGYTPLHLAAQRSDPACAKLLLAHPDIEVNFHDTFGDTLLHLASQIHIPEIVKLLLDHPDIQVNAQTRNGSTPLHLASQVGRHEIVSLLLAHSDIQVNLKNTSGETPLHLNSRRNDAMQVKLLLAHPDIQVNAQTRNGSTPLHLASQVNHPEIAKLLLAHPDIQANLENEDSNTPLHVASQSNDPDLVELLLAHPDVQVNAQSRNGNTPLHLASQFNLPEIAKLLLAHPDIQANLENEDSNTPLHVASQSNDPDLVELLLAHPDIQVNAQTRNGSTPLHLASQVNHPEVVKLLLANPDIQVNLTNSHCGTPLYLACAHGYFSIVELLVGHSNTEINFKDRAGNTPLHIACKQGDVVMAKILLGAGGADPTCCNLSGETPLQVATVYEIVKILLRLNNNKTDYPIDSYVKIFVVGNNEAGKSTLISSLREEASSLRKILPTQYRRTKGVETHTAGIIPLQFNNSRFGNVILYDFAGHLEYHSSHSAVLENTITSSTPVFIVVVDVSANPDEITANLHRWLFFIENHSTKAASPPHGVVVGSHIDKVKSRRESMEERSAAVIRALGASSASFKHILHDCRDTACAGLDQLCSFLTQSCSIIRESSQVDIRCHVLYAFILAKFPDNAACRVRDIQGKITEEDYLIPTHIQALFSLLKTLSDKGQVLLLQSSEGPADCFVVLKIAELLHEVNGTLFAPHQFRQHKDFVNNTGLSSRSRIEVVFPLYDPKMIIGYLEQMEFCRRIDYTLTVIHSVPGSSAEPLDPSEEHYFFPALIQDESPSEVWEDNDSMDYQFGWCLQCSEPHHYLTSRFLHILLLRLAFSFALAPEPHQQDPTSPVLTRCCSVWKNGIQWLDLAGIETIVEVREHEAVVMVMMRCTESALIPFAHLRSSVLKTVLEAKCQICPKTITREYLVNPSDLQYPPRDTSQTAHYSLPQAAEALLTSQPNTVDQYGKNLLRIDKLLSFEPLCILDLSQEILQELFDPQHPSDSHLKALLASQAALSTQPLMQNSVQGKFELSSRTLNTVFQEAKRSGVRFIQRLFEAWSPYQKPTFREVLHKLLDQYSILCGRNLLEAAGRGLHKNPTIQQSQAVACTTEFEQLPTPEDSATGYQTAVISPSLCHLTTEHLKVVRRELWDVRHKWRKIGVELDLRLAELECIQAKHKDDFGACLEDMIIVLLKRTEPKVTWGIIIAALKEPTVGEEGVAFDIADKYLR